MTKKSDQSIRCSCGSLSGVAREVSSRSGNRCVCYCDDCQAFAHFLGRADRILDRQGGTDIFQMSPALVEISDGADHLACMRLRPKGLLRWYADCCNTPIGNTLIKPGIPFIGLIHSCFPQASGGPSRNEVLGPVRARVNCRFATGQVSGVGVHDKAPVTFLIRFLGLVLKWRLHGAHKRSPFFDATSGKPSVTPRVLSEAELQAVVQASDGSPQAT